MTNYNGTTLVMAKYKINKDQADHIFYIISPLAKLYSVTYQETTVIDFCSKLRIEIEL